jgi:hypothetical protein
MSEEKYDSRKDTLEHKRRVAQLMIEFVKIITLRGIDHDNSKLEQPEKEYFDIHTPKLKKLTYGSAEYNESLKELQIALNHHYQNNSHHPEYYKNGIDGMNLFDIIELFADWKAATERHEDGSIAKSLEINKDRFKMSDQLLNIFKNTAKELGWIENEEDEKK